MYEPIFIKDPIKPYEKARSLGKREKLINRLFKQNSYLPSLENTLNEYNHYFDNNSSFEGFIDPKILYGTLSTGRSYDFSKNFYPLKHFNEGDFGHKWLQVYNNIPLWIESKNKILVYEFLHKFYVVEGNKRTSVAKYLNLPFIDASIIRIIPNKIDNQKVLEYYKFLEFENKTKISTIWFSSKDKYDQLYDLIDSFSKNKKDKYIFFMENIYNPFLKNFRKFNFNHLNCEVGDVFLDYIKKINNNYQLNDNQITKTIKSCIK
jgi:basic membrane protein A and related proteins